MPSKLNLVGQIFSRLTVISEDPVRQHGAVKWICLCECGTILSIYSTSLKSKKTKSCGCLNIEVARETNTSHGYYKHPLYIKRKAMIQRCYNPNHSKYKYYGGRGITIHSEWLTNAKAFVEWGLSNGYKKDLEIDRRNNDKSYTPDNCRFVTRSINCINAGNRNNTSSIYKGVSLYNTTGKYESYIDYNSKHIYIGKYNTEELAVKARNQYIEAHGLPHKIQTYTI